MRLITDSDLAIEIRWLCFYCIQSVISNYSVPFPLCSERPQSSWNWQGPLETIWSSTPFTQNPLKHINQAHVHVAFEYVQARRYLSGQPVPDLCHPHSKYLFAHVQSELSVFQFVPTTSHPISGHHWQEWGPIFLTPSLQILTCHQSDPSWAFPRLLDGVVRVVLS